MLVDGFFGFFPKQGQVSLRLPEKKVQIKSQDDSRIIIRCEAYLPANIGSILLNILLVCFASKLAKTNL